MKKNEIAGLLSLIFFIAILFMPSGTNYWIYLLAAGIAFGIVWWMKK